MTEELKCPKGISEEVFRKVEEIIIDGFEKEMPSDKIKTALIKHTEIPFNRLNGVYNLITKHHNLVVNVSEIKTQIREEIERKYNNSDPGITFEWNDIDRLTYILEQDNPLFTKQRTLAVLRQIFKEKDMPFPKKTRVVKGRVGVVHKTVIEVFLNNAQATEKELMEALVGVVKNAKDYAKKYHKLAYALTNHLTIKEVFEQLK